MLAGEERASALASRLALARPTVSATIDTLVERALLERTAVDGDRRAVRLSLTELGRDTMEDAERGMRARLDELLTFVDDPVLVDQRARPDLRRTRCQPRRAPVDVNDAGWLRKLWPFLARHKRSAIIAFAVAIGATAITTVTPLIERAIIDNSVVGDAPAGPLLVLLVGIGLVQFVLAYVRRFVGGRYALDVQHDLRLVLFEKLQHLDFARHDELPTGQLVSRASSDLQLVQMLLSFLPMLTGNVIMVILSLAVMLWLSPLLTLVALVTVPGLLFVVAEAALDDVSRAMGRAATTPAWWPGWSTSR